MMSTLFLSEDLSRVGLIAGLIDSHMWIHYDKSKDLLVIYELTILIKI